MTLTDLVSVDIKGRILGAYKEEPGFLIDGYGLTSLTEILKFLLDGGGGSGAPDGNGIYSGSGSIPNATVATANGSFKLLSDGKSIIFGKDGSGTNSYLYKLSNGPWGIRVSETISGAQLECDFQILKSGIYIETDSATSPGVTKIENNKDSINFTATNSALSKVVIINITPISVKLTGIPAYANDAAADADSALLSGSLYTVTGGRALLKKP